MRQWRGQYWMDLLGVYLRAPVKEIYPAAEGAGPDVFPVLRHLWLRGMDGMQVYPFMPR